MQKSVSRMAAVVMGMANKNESGPATDRELYSMTEEEFKEFGIRQLLGNLMAATAALSEDGLADEVMGTSMRNSYLAYRVDEWERYHQIVTDWEVQE